MKALSTLLLSASLLLAWGGAAAAESAEPVVEGRDYVLVDNGQPWRPLDGKIEVVEVFAYTCPHCAEFQPELSAWVRNLPKDVRFTYVPAAYDPNDPFARTFFVAEQAGALPRTHDALFAAIHHDGLIARNATLDELAWFYAQHGMVQSQVKAASASPEVDREMQRARAFELGIKLPGTPTMVVDGRYLITPHSHADALRIADGLIAKLRSTH
jgi:thiol:disulfide interchange protein DsbA